MAQPRLHLSNISFTYDGMSRPLFDLLSLDLHAGWTGLVGANGIGKSTLLELAVGRLEPDGAASGPGGRSAGPVWLRVTGFAEARDAGKAVDDSVNGR